MRASLGVSTPSRIAKEIKGERKGAGQKERKNGKVTVRRGIAGIAVSTLTHGDEQKSQQILDHASDGSDDPAEIALQNEETARLREALKRLPSDLAEVIQLRFAEGSSLETVATKLGITEQFLNKRLKKAYAELKEIMLELAQNSLEAKS
jgi:RNA polymerase sigma factor (sigma-70 family)